MPCHADYTSQGPAEKEAVIELSGAQLQHDASPSLSDDDLDFEVSAASGELAGYVPTLWVMASMQDETFCFNMQIMQVSCTCLMQASCF